MYKVGDFVTFYESYEIREKARLDENGDYVFEFCDVSEQMFEDFPWTWPIEVIRGLAEDQRRTDEET